MEVLSTPLLPVTCYFLRIDQETEMADQIDWVSSDPKRKRRYRLIPDRVQ